MNGVTDIIDPEQQVSPVCRTEDLLTHPFNVAIATCKTTKTTVMVYGLVMFCCVKVTSVNFLHVGNFEVYTYTYIENVGAKFCAPVAP